MRFFGNKIFKGIVLGLFLLAEIAFLAGPETALAACNYEITELSVKNPAKEWQYIHEASPSDEIAVIARVKKSGISSECYGSVTGGIFHNIQLNERNIGWVSIYSQKDFDLQYTAGQAEFVYRISLKNFDRSVLASANRMDFRLRICQMVAYGAGNASTTSCEPRQTSAVYTVTISGATGGSGEVSMTAFLDPVKSSYSKDESVKICANLNKTQLAALSPNITDISYVTRINGAVFNSYSQKREWFNTNTPCQPVTINTTNKFGNGSNNFSVELWQAGTSIKISEGRGTINATGLDATAPPAGGGGTPPGTDGTPGGSTGATTPRVDCTKDRSSTDCLYNPLPTGDLTTMFLLIAKGTLGLVAVWAVIFIIVGGFRMVTAAGNEEAYAQAKRTVTWAILGVVVAVLSFSIVAIVQDLLKADIKSTIEAPANE